MLSRRFPLLLAGLAGLGLLLACPPPDGGDDAGAADAGGDQLAPTILSHSPDTGATEVALDAVVSVTFSEAIDCATVTTSMFQIVGASAQLGCAGDTITLTPNSPFEIVTSYTVFFFGANAVADPAGNLLADDLSWSFTTGIGDDTTPPAAPTADSPAAPSPTSQARVIVGGSKEAEASVELRWSVGSTVQQDWHELIPLGTATTWVATLALELGTNTLELRSKDRAARASEVTTVTVVREADPGTALAGGQLKIAFELRDLWNDIGDEFYVWHDGTSTLNYYSVDIWVEGPYASGASCHFNTTTQQREDTRYVATLVHGHDRNESQPYFGFWQYANYRVPNYLAALIEAEQWRYAGFPLAVDVDRRNPDGEQWPVDLACDNPLSFVGGTNLCLPRMQQRPVVDGMTEATIRSDTAAPTVPGSWTGPRSYTWDLTDRYGRQVAPGTYLISLVVTVDRAQSGPALEGVQADADRETCWDDPSHDSKGAHRAEGLITLDGSTPAVLLWDEKGHHELVDACDNAVQPAGVVDVCNCSGSDANVWPCNTSNPNPNSRVGEPVRYLTADKFDGAHAVRVEYCPDGPCS